MFHCKNNGKQKSKTMNEGNRRYTKKVPSAVLKDKKYVGTEIIKMTTTRAQKHPPVYFPRCNGVSMNSGYGYSYFLCFLLIFLFILIYEVQNLKSSKATRTNRIILFSMN